MSGCCHISPVCACWIGWVSAVSDPHGSRRSHVSVRRLSCSPSGQRSVGAALVTGVHTLTLNYVGNTNFAPLSLCQEYQLCRWISWTVFSIPQNAVLCSVNWASVSRICPFCVCMRQAGTVSSVCLHFSKMKHIQPVLGTQLFSVPCGYCTAELRQTKTLYNKMLRLEEGRFVCLKKI